MLSAAELEYVRNTSLYRLAVATPNGVPHCVPMRTRLDGGRIIVGGFNFDISYKKNVIERNPRVACVWDTEEGIGDQSGPGNIKGVEVRGTLIPTGTIVDGSGAYYLEPSKVFSWGVEEPASESFAKKMTFDVDHLTRRGS